jgi:hypothetical protein
MLPFFLSLLLSLVVPWGFGIDWDPGYLDLNSDEASGLLGRDGWGEHTGHGEGEKEIGAENDGRKRSKGTISGGKKR